MEGQKGETPTLSDALYHQLRRDILTNVLQPGQKLKVEPLRQRYQVGATPLREALSRLAAYGLVEQANQRGFRVPEVCEQELEDICQTRIRIESSALELAIANGDDEWEAKVLAAQYRLEKLSANDSNDPETLALWESRHNEFHQQLISACGSHWLLRFADTLLDQFDRYRRLTPNFLGGRDALNSQHAELVALALRRDSANACKVLASHIQHSTNSVRVGTQAFLAQRQA